MALDYTVAVDDSPNDYTYHRDRPLAERELIDLGEGVQVVVDAIESEPEAGQPGRVRAHRHYNIVHEST
jgi:hypothetical protein